MAKNIFSGLFGKKKKSDDPKEEGHEESHENLSSDNQEGDDPEHLSEIDALDKDIEGAEYSSNSKEEIAIASEEISEEQLSLEEIQEEKDAEDEVTDDKLVAEKGASDKKSKLGFFSRLTSGLSKSSHRLSQGVSSIFTKKKLDDEMLEELEDLLISSDLGLPAASRITTTLAKTKFDKQVSDEEVRAALAQEVVTTLGPLELSLDVNDGHKPHVILMTGVNGAGKTTTLGKLAAKFKGQGKSVMLAAGDTFRAAAIEQLSVWGERTSTPVIARAVGADAAGLVFDAMKQAQEDDIDILMIDTAGRLQNKTELMDELAKIIRVIRKVDDTAPHNSVLVLDATVGQNALSQVEVFRDVADVTGLVMTKLDGTARGGVLVAVADKFSLPIHYIGVGEGVEDLQPFTASRFAYALTGLEIPSLSSSFND